MRVLVVADVSAEKVIGGAERMLVNHARALLGDGHTVTLLTRQPRKNAVLRCETRPGVVEYRLPYSGNRGVAGLHQLRAGARDWWREHREDFDIAVAEQPFTIWALLKAGCRLPRLQIVHSFAFEEYATRHGLDWNARHWLVTQAMYRLEKRVYGGAGHVLVLSEYMQCRLMDGFGLASARISAVPGGVEIPELTGSEARLRVRDQLGWAGPVVVTLRNLVPRTGVDLLVQAAAILRHDMPDIRWCIMGAGALLEPLREFSRQLNVDDRVEFTGYLPESDVVQRMQAADAFMLPTRSLEGFGLVTIEANACGLPVVATPVGANPEVVATSDHNRVADDASPQALASAMLDVLGSSHDRQISAGELRENCRQRYSWGLHDQKFLRLLEKVSS